MLVLKNIVKEYVSGGETLRVLKEIDLTIKDGEFVAIMGPSGSGKSTLMNIIGLLDTPTSGTYALDDIQVDHLPSSQEAFIRGSKIGFVFQGYNLVPRIDALHQVMLPLSYQGIPTKERMIKAEEALKKVGLGEKIHHKPNQLSGGQQQRVAVARALVTNPSLILADEPTGALDSKTGEEVMQLFRKLNDDGTTIVLITHDQQVASYAKRVVHIKDGNIT